MMIIPPIPSNLAYTGSGPTYVSAAWVTATAYAKNDVRRYQVSSIWYDYKCLRSPYLLRQHHAHLRLFLEPDRHRRHFGGLHLFHQCPPLQLRQLGQRLPRLCMEYPPRRGQPSGLPSHRGYQRRGQHHPPILGRNQQRRSHRRALGGPGSCQCLGALRSGDYHPAPGLRPQRQSDRPGLHLHHRRHHPRQPTVPVGADRGQDGQRPHQGQRALPSKQSPPPWTILAPSP
jgi:hypothetical protein